MISIEDISLSYRDNLIISSASMEIKNNAVTALLGESGAGKSTVARLLTGLLMPETGRVMMDSQLLVSSSQKYDRKKGLSIQMVQQHPYLSLDPRQRISDGFLEIIRYHHMAEKGKEKELIREVTEAVGLGAVVINHLPGQISGGEAQRVSLAKALLFKPQLLILDEATSMLDVSTQANVLSLVKRIREKSGLSVLLITHDSELSETYSDYIYRIENKTIRREK